MPDAPCPALLRASSFIDKAKKAGIKDITITRKLFSYDLPFVFEGKEEVAFDICNKVALQFNVPISHVKVVGSAQIGYSLFRRRPFRPKYSDLDLAIIDGVLFRKYCELSYGLTKGYSDFTKFIRIDDVSVSTSFIQNIARGYFRPDHMPLSLDRDSWTRFFSALSSKHTELFSGINCGIYFSDAFFESKQALAIEEYWGGRQ